MDAAQTIFSEIKEGQFAKIQNFVDIQEPESLYLDFKRKESNETSEASKKDKEIISEAISGFANSEGGVLIWGVDARKNADGVDGACDLFPIPNVRTLHSYLQSNYAKWIAPSHIELEIIFVTNGPQSEDGFIIMYVPKWDGEPIMNMQNKKVKMYYKRGGDSFYQMEHYEVADRFGKRPYPKLKIDCCLIAGGVSSPPNGPYGIHVHVGMKNDGLGIAKYPYLYIKNQAKNHCKWKCLNIKSSQRNIGTANEYFREYRGGVSEIIHNKDTYWFCELTIDYPPKNQLTNGQEVFLKLVYGSESAHQEEEEIKVTNEQLNSYGKFLYDHYVKYGKGYGKPISLENLSDTV